MQVPLELVQEQGLEQLPDSVAEQEPMVGLSAKELGTAMDTSCQVNSQLTDSKKADSEGSEAKIHLAELASEAQEILH